MAFRAPVLGYNTNVRHKGRLFHIQTEDSGLGHPHVITHLFADGGRIVASKKTAYSDHLGAENLAELVKKLMQAQHKQMFIALRDGVYDEDGEGGPKPGEAARPKSEPPQLYREAPPAQASGAQPPAAPSKVSALFSREPGGQSLDEVILRYLAQEDA